MVPHFPEAVDDHDAVCSVGPLTDDMSARGKKESTTLLSKSLAVARRERARVEHAHEVGHGVQLRGEVEESLRHLDPAELETLFLHLRHTGHRKVIALRCAQLLPTVSRLPYLDPRRVQGGASSASVEQPATGGDEKR